MQPTVIVIGGPNGAGKTTFARELLLTRLPDYFEFLNADMTADGMSPFKPHKAAMRAGREFLKRFDDKSEKRESFIVESTLSGKALADRLERIQKTGYTIELAYLWLPTEESAISRVAERVRQGGHDIHADVIKRRFKRSYPNFISRYRFIADRWTLLDGSATPPVTVLQKEKGSPAQTLQPAAAQKMGTNWLQDGKFVQEENIAYGKDDQYFLTELDGVLERIGEFVMRKTDLVF